MHKDPEKASGSGTTAWETLWPLIGVALLQDQSSGAYEFAGALLDSSPQRLPGALTAMLDKAVADWEKDESEAVSICLGRAIDLAQELGYL